MTIATVLLTTAVWLVVAQANEQPRISEAVADENGFHVHVVESPYQAGKTQIRVLVPDNPKPDNRFPVVYVLPVEAQNEHRYGDGLQEIKKHDLHNKNQVIFVAPTFSKLPWYADHPSDPTIRQETYFLKVVVPLVDKEYPVQTVSEGRLLLGFSKSGWGAWALLLRHPDVFGRAAAWDAPLMLDRLGRYGTPEIFGTRENFEEYRIDNLVRTNAKALHGGARLILTGYDSFRAHHQKMHVMLDGLKVQHDYRDGPKRSHDWHSGWVPEAVELLLDQR